MLDCYLSITIHVHSFVTDDPLLPFTCTLMTLYYHTHALLYYPVLQLWMALINNSWTLTIQCSLQFFVNDTLLQQLSLCCFVYYSLHALHDWWWAFTTVPMHFSIIIILLWLYTTILYSWTTLSLSQQLAQHPCLHRSLVPRPLPPAEGGYGD